MPPKGWKKPKAEKPQPAKQPDEMGDDLRGLPQMSRVAILKTEAEILADRNGHDLDPWIEEAGWAHATCSRCKGRIAVAEHPPAKAQAVQPDAKIGAACR